MVQRQPHFARWRVCIDQPSPQDLLSNEAVFDLQCTGFDDQGAVLLESSSNSGASATPDYDSDGGNGGGGGVRGGSFGSGGGRSDSNDDPADDSLPEDMKAALLYGSLSRDAISRYYKALRNPLIKLFLSVPSFRSRFLMDSSFLFKLLVQEIIGNGTALASEIAVRGKDIANELEYVASDLIVGTVIEAAFVWLLAPTITLPNSASSSIIAKYFSSLPASIFQSSTAVQSYSILQRLVSFFYAAAQYAAIGFAGGVIGTAITYALLETRKKLDKDYKPLRPMPPVIPNSLGWAAFMAVSSNTRFQVVEGLEMGAARLLRKTSQSLVNYTIIALRFINNYWGGVQFVRFFRAIGLHATGDEGDAQSGGSE